MKLFIWLIPIVSRYNLERWIISLNLNKVIVHDIDITIYDEYCVFSRMKIQIFPKSNSPVTKNIITKLESTVRQSILRFFTPALLSFA